MVEDIELELEIERQETLFLLIKCFIESSVIRRGRIESALSKLEKVLDACVRDEQYLSLLEIWYVKQGDDDSTKKGEVTFKIDWDVFSAEIEAGKSKLTISEDDILGSISPLYRKLADEVRMRCIRDGINDLRWSLSYVPEVYSDKELHRELNKQLGLITGENKEMARMETNFRKRPRERIKVRISDAREIQSTVVWESKKE